MSFKKRPRYGDDGEKEEERGIHQQGSNKSFSLSVALPGSIVENAQSAELRTYLVGQIGRALAVFQVDEVVVFDDTAQLAASGSGMEVLEGEFKGAGNENSGDGNVFLARLLEYLETPQYLRRLLFPHHPDLRYAGLLNPLDCPHHLRKMERCKWREGVTLGPTANKSGFRVQCGFDQEVVVPSREHLKEKQRVTVEFSDESQLKGKIVSRKVPQEKGQLYWGYRVRLAGSLNKVWEECPYPEGYDLSIGTSERGDSVDSLEFPSAPKHVLVVFGGVQGLEPAVEADPELQSYESVPSLFNFWLNTCPAQGSRTIRTEEAVLVTLSVLRTKWSGGK